MIDDAARRRRLVTGAAGLIGFRLAQLPLAAGWSAARIDRMKPCCDVALKRAPGPPRARIHLQPTR
jgi:NAD(P)-dependent dehydrogenase (short-subunit alcohol dehydrogenase family)